MCSNILCVSPFSMSRVFFLCHIMLLLQGAIMIKLREIFLARIVRRLRHHGDSKAKLSIMIFDYGAGNHAAPGSLSNMFLKGTRNILILILNSSQNANRNTVWDMTTIKVNPDSSRFGLMSVN